MLSNEINNIVFTKTQRSMVTYQYQFGNYYCRMRFVLYLLPFYAVYMPFTCRLHAGNPSLQKDLNFNCPEGKSVSQCNGHRSPQIPPLPDILQSRKTAMVLAVRHPAVQDGTDMECSWDLVTDAAWYYLKSQNRARTDAFGQDTSSLYRAVSSLLCPY